MSVLVKNMKIPVSCYECPMAEEMDMQEDWHKCKLLNKEFYSWDVTEDTKEYHRPKECPLVEVPTPHGRLIDEDELHKNVTKAHAYEHLSVKRIIAMIHKSPTVIEAEE